MRILYITGGGAAHAFSPLLTWLILAGAAWGLIRFFVDLFTTKWARWLLVAGPLGWILALRHLEKQPCTCATSTDPCPRHGRFRKPI